MKHFYSLLLLFSLTAGLTARSALFERSGSFIQLNRSLAEQPVEAWRDLLETMKSAGLDTVIVQWTSEPPIVYFDYRIDISDEFTEYYTAIEHLFLANQDVGLDVYLGLQNDPDYWSQIQGRDRVLRDFFLVRLAQNEHIQKELLDRFDANPAWQGYYIPDEIDDKTWRHPSKRSLIRQYVHHMAERLRVNDADRDILISTFFRGRTSPRIVAENLLDIVSGSEVDALLLQDGVGTGDPPVDYLGAYYDAILSAWKQAPTPATNAVPEDAEANTEPSPASEDRSAQESPDSRPELWAIVESFRQTSAPGDPFSAEPTGAETLRQQMTEAAESFDTMILFTYPDYMLPSLGPKAAKLDEELRTLLQHTTPDD